MSGAHGRPKRLLRLVPSSTRGARAAESEVVPPLCRHGLAFLRPAVHSRPRYNIMNQKSEPLVLGKPLFSDKRLAAIAAKNGTLAAWQQTLLERNAVGAAQAVSGDFAIGLQDPQGHVFLAVDRFAMQTLCYRVVDGNLRFARRADELADADPQIDTQAIFDYLYFHVIPSPQIGRAHV